MGELAGADPRRLTDVNSSSCSDEQPLFRAPQRALNRSAHGVLFEPSSVLIGDIRACPERGCRAGDGPFERLTAADGELDADLNLDASSDSGFGHLHHVAVERDDRGVPPGRLLTNVVVAVEESAAAHAPRARPGGLAHRAREFVAVLADHGAMVVHRAELDEISNAGRNPSPVRARAIGPCHSPKLRNRGAQLRRHARRSVLPEPELEGRKRGRIAERPESARDSDADSGVPIGEGGLQSFARARRAGMP